MKTDNPQQQYKLLHKLYVLFDDGDRHTLRGLGLTTTQYAVLMLLESDAGKRLTDIGRQLLIAKSTVTRIIDQLEEQHLISRIADPKDRRAQRITLTVLGLERQHSAEKAHLRSIRERMAILSEEEQAMFNNLMLKLCTGLREGLQDN